jgi:pimeloyl-ACP methyl ester carboxylesterase
MRDGATIRLRVYGKAGSTRIALSHGNGFAINAYLPFWQPLIEHFELFLFDARNHGENPLHNVEHHTWPTMVDDFEEIFQAINRKFGEAPIIGAFHSLTSVVSIKHTLKYGPRWSALALFDSPVMPPDGHFLQILHHRDMNELVKRSLRRRDIFDKPSSFAKLLITNPAYSGWVSGSHQLFAESTLQQLPDETWTLACPRHYEAEIYRTNIDTTVWPRLSQLPVPSILIGGDPSHPYATPPASICRAIHDEVGLPYIMIPKTTHFLQMENPDACRLALLNFINSLSLSNDHGHRIERNRS